VAHLYELTADWQRIIAAIEDADGELDEELEAALDEIQDALEHKIEGIGSIAECITGDIDTAKGAIKRLQAKVGALSNGLLRLKAYTQHQLESAGLKKVKGPTFTASLRKAPARVEITDIDLLPEVHTVTTVTTRPDKKSIAAVVKATGLPVPGAEIVTGGTYLVLK